MYNKIILIGNLTKDPELRYTPQGTPVCNIRIAVNSRIKQSDGTYKDDPLFIGAVIFGKAAENAGQHLTKGKSVLVEGRLQERRWEKEGVPKSIFEVIANSVKYLSQKKAEDRSQGDDIPPSDAMADLEPF